MRFAVRIPVELEGKTDRQLSALTIISLNRLYAEVEKGSTYCEGCMDCLTAKMGLLPTDPRIQTESASRSGDIKQTARQCSLVL